MPYVDEATLKFFEKKISKLNDNLIKNGILPIIYDVDRKIVSYATLRGFNYNSKVCPPEWHTTMYKVIDINLKKDIFIPKTSWTLVAIINHIDNIIINIDENINVEKFRNNSFCDHCKTKRVRNTTLIVKNENGELKSIGKNCASNYFGYDLSCWLNKLSWYTWNPQCFQKDYEEFKFSFSNIQVYKCEDIVSLAYSLISKYGFASSHCENSTKKMMEDNISISITNKEKEIADKIIEWAKNISDENDSFMCNLKSVFSNEHISNKAFAFIAAGVNKYLKLKKKTSNFIGNIGDKKVKFENVTYENCYSFTTELAFKYTITYIHKFVDENGNIIIWKTGKNIPEENIGKKLNFTATIKEHKIYKNDKQTIISYVKF